MNTIINILPWLLAIAAGTLYFFTKMMLRDNLEKLKIAQENIAKYQSDCDSLEDEVAKVATDKAALEYDVKAAESDKQSLREMLESVIQERDALKSALEYPVDLTQSAPVKYSEFPLIFSAEIDFSTLDISLKDLIGNDKLHEVFLSLLKSNLLPASIEDKIDYQRDSFQVVIWTQEFDEVGEAANSYTWKQITDQILTKKQIVTDYLHGVIQDSDRAMVVHQALTNKPKKEVSNA